MSEILDELQKRKKTLVLAALYLGFFVIAIGIWPFNNLSAKDQWVLMVIDALVIAGIMFCCGLFNLIDKAAEHGERKFK